MARIFPRMMVAVLLACATAIPAARRPRTSASSRSTPLPRTSATVRRWLKSMTLRDEVAQLVFIPVHTGQPSTRSREYRKFVHLIRETKVGGLILINVSNGHGIQKAEPYAAAALFNRAQRMARVPLLVGADFERGASMRVDGTTPFPHAMAFGAAGDPALSRTEGEVTAREARALGVQWVYYPVADVNNNPNNPIINVRSFGEDPQAVAAHVKAFIEGAHSDKRNSILVTAKHFPGHGDTAVDSHLNLAVINADRERLDRVELVPFKAAIEAGVDAIMTAHLAVPALAPPDLPATLSPAILTGLLRKDLGFKGLVITDALDMGGIANGFSTGEACVRALEAGADTLLMPGDPDTAVKAVVAAVENGRLARRRIDDSVIRLLTAKEKLGLDRRRFVDVEAVGDVIDAPEAAEKAQEIADRAVTLVRNTNNVVPLAHPERACYVALSEGRYSSEGQAFTQEIRKRARSASIATLDPTMPRTDLDQAVSKLGPCDAYAVAAFSTASSYRGSIGLDGDLPHVMDLLTASGRPVALVAMGNPYLLRNFPNVAAYLATFSTVQPSEIAAVKALWGEIEIRGHLPVTIPGFAARGDGIMVTRSAAQAGTPVPQ